MEDELGGISAPQSLPPVVVGYNGKEHSRQALLWAAAEATRRRLPLLVVFAANYPGMAADPLEPGALEADEEVTARGIREALDTSPDLQVSGITEVISPTRAMIEASASSALVVIGTRGHGSIAGALLGSVAFAVAAARDELAAEPEFDHTVVNTNVGSAAQGLVQLMAGSRPGSRVP